MYGPLFVVYCWQLYGFSLSSEQSYFYRRSQQSFSSSTTVCSRASRSLVSRSKLTPNESHNLRFNSLWIVEQCRTMSSEFHLAMGMTPIRAMPNPNDLWKARLSTCQDHPSLQQYFFQVSSLIVLKRCPCGKCLYAQFEPWIANHSCDISQLRGFNQMGVRCWTV